MKRILLLIIVLVQSSTIFSQAIVITAVTAVLNQNKPYLTETKVLDRYPLYQTINNYDFEGKNVKIDFRDWRDSLNIKNVDCSKINIKNETEFNSEIGSQIVKAYLDSLFEKANLVIEENNKSEKIQVRLNALDSKKSGFVVSKVHGICQMEFEFKDFKQTYCIDLQDGQPNSPLGRTTIIYAKEAKEVMLCASIREVIESFLKDFKIYIDKV